MFASLVKKRVVLVDDHPLIRQGVRMLVSQEADMEICGEASGAYEALQVIQQTQPDVVVADLRLAEGSGLDLIRDVRERFPQASVLVLLMRDEGFFVERVLRAGARGYITKDEGPARVIEGIRRVLAGEIYVSQKMATRLMSQIAGPRGADAGPAESKLTDRELAVFEQIGRGVPAREIADALHISVKTVESHREHIKEKLGLDNAAELLKHAIEWVGNQRER